MDSEDKDQEARRKLEQIRERRRIKNKEMRLERQRNKKLQLLHDEQRIKNIGGNLHLVAKSNVDITVSSTCQANKLDLSSHEYPTIHEANRNRQFVHEYYSEPAERESFIQNTTSSEKHQYFRQNDAEYTEPKHFGEKAHMLENVSSAPSKVKNNTAFTRNINELLVKNVHQKMQNKPLPNAEVNIYQGNPLDADKPERFSGKFKTTSDVKKVTALKRGILLDNKIRNANGCKESIINYIHCQLTPDLEEKVLVFLKELVKLQKNMFTKNKTKAQMKKRYVLGFSQCTRYVLGNQVKLLIIATDHQITREEDTLLTEINKIRDISIQRNVEIMYAFTKRRLGSITKTFCLISCLAVLNVDGIHDQLYDIFKDYNSIKEQTKI